ncbi:MAG: ABC transporter ATP-binding protein [Burkholderiales bacterium]
MSAQGASTPILELENVTLQFGDVRAMSDLNCFVRKGELLSIVGPNGAGKTSTLDCISGRYRPASGVMRHKGEIINHLSPDKRAALGIGRTFQNLALFDHMSVLDNILVGRHHLMKAGFLRGMLYWIGGAEREETEHRAAVEGIIDFLDIRGIRDEAAGTLSIGQRKCVELARAIAMKPEILLLDEPVAGMNLEEKEDTARVIVDLNKEWGTTIVMIEHAMGTLTDLSHRVMVLDLGRNIAEGTPNEIKRSDAVRRAYRGDPHTDAVADPASEAVQ